MKPAIRNWFTDWFHKSKWFGSFHNRQNPEALEAAFRAGFEKGRKFGHSEAADVLTK